jgi:hypothetical protein
MIKSFSATLATDKTPDGREVKIMLFCVEDDSGIMVETNIDLPFQDLQHEPQEQNFRLALTRGLSQVFEVMKDQSNILPRFT